MTADTTSQDFFERKYRATRDPWGFACTPYEQDRYAAIYNAVNHRRYRRALEPGCSIGVLTERLATICDRVNALDIAPSAVAQAKERCRALPNVEVVCAALPDIPVVGEFDLIVLSEVGYYFRAPELYDLGRLLFDRLGDSGVLLASHWQGVSDEHLLGGDQVHDILGSLDGVMLEHSEKHSGFRIDRYVRS